MLCRVVLMVYQSPSVGGRHSALAHLSHTLVIQSKGRIMSVLTFFNTCSPSTRTFLHRDTHTHTHCTPDLGDRTDSDEQVHKLQWLIMCVATWTRWGDWEFSSCRWSGLAGDLLKGTEVYCPCFQFEAHFTAPFQRGISLSTAQRVVTTKYYLNEDSLGHVWKLKFTT